MRDAPRIVVGARTGADDDLLLPRPPGVLRRFWARHPRLTDVLVALLAVVTSVPAVTVRAPYPTPTTPLEVAIATSLILLGGVALVFRRRRPLLVFVVAAAPLVLLPPPLVMAVQSVGAFALYAVAVFRSARACWIAFGAASGAVAVYTVVAALVTTQSLSFLISASITGIVTLLIGALIGVNVGNRRRYTDALIERSRQLAVERDQQGRLAAAAERARIAREMHDIVSHSLTVIVALSEGAAAAGSADSARDASRRAAETARGALDEMRAMLGVLRDADDPATPLLPLEPVDPVDVVDAAQRAGFPVVSEITGDVHAAPRSVRFALGRVVQESVTNAMRHAPDAQRLRVAIEVGADAVHVAVDDDGAASAPAGSPGYGLRGLRERVELVGGALAAGPRESGGWRVAATLPFTPDDPAPARDQKGDAP